MKLLILMLLIVLFVPIILLGFGVYCQKSGGPKEINLFFGYRSNLSVKNIDTWSFAHKCCGKVWKFLGWITLFISIVLILFLFNKDIDIVIGAIVIIGIQTVVALPLSIILVEVALRKEFDKEGNRKDNIFIEKVNIGLTQSEKGMIYSEEESSQKLSKWLI